MPWHVMQLKRCGCFSEPRLLVSPQSRPSELMTCSGERWGNHLRQGVVQRGLFQHTGEQRGGIREGVAERG